MSACDGTCTRWVIRQSSGGSEWAAVYGNHTVVWFTAMGAEIIYDEQKHPMVQAVVHPVYCDNYQNPCEITMPLPLFADPE
jgi:K+ transporter